VTRLQPVALPQGLKDLAPVPDRPRALGPGRTQALGSTAPGSDRPQVQEGLALVPDWPRMRQGMALGPGRTQALGSTAPGSDRPQVQEGLALVPDWPRMRQGLALGSGRTQALVSGRQAPAVEELLPRMVAPLPASRLRL
jgi:hypothetical protein